jgi:hypothetical protein
MGELTTDDVEQFTAGRMLADDPEVERMLAAALVTARREVGWHVSPVIEDDELILDGPGSRILTLPTRKLVELTTVVEDGTSLNIDDLNWSAGGPPGILERPISVRKRSGGWWSGDYQGVAVTMDHGYTEEEAADWRQAVLTLVDQMGSLVGVGRGESDLVSKKVDDVTYTWGNPYSAMAEGVLYSVKSILCDYELPRLEFL